MELFFQQVQEIEPARLERFDLIGISTITTTVNEAYRIAARAKALGKTVVMGGPHVSAMADEALDHCDYVVRGEAEDSFLALIDALNGGSELDAVPGLSRRVNGVSVHNPSSVTKVDMGQIPDSDFLLCERFAGGEKEPAIMMFSRGCPYDCNFCSVTTTFGRKYRYKNTQQMVDELKRFKDRSVSFTDDNFAANPKMTKQLLRAMIEQKAVPKRYSCQLRINAAADEELLSLLKATNCRIAYIGMESVNPETLKYYQKGQTVESIVGAIEAFKKHKIGIHGMFVLGADHDRVSTVAGTVDFALATGIDTIQLCALTPFPGTAVYDEMTAAGRVLHTNWDLYDGLHVVVQPRNMTPYELQHAIINQMKRFYSLRHAWRIDWDKRWRLTYRMAGRVLVNRWIGENAAYLEYLKRLPPAALRSA